MPPSPPPPVVICNITFIPRILSTPVKNIHETSPADTHWAKITKIDYTGRPSKKIVVISTLANPKSRQIFFFF